MEPLLQLTTNPKRVVFHSYSSLLRFDDECDTCVGVSSLHQFDGFYYSCCENIPGKRQDKYTLEYCFSLFSRFIFSRPVSLYGIIYLLYTVCFCNSG